MEDKGRKSEREIVYKVKHKKMEQTFVVVFGSPLGHDGRGRLFNVFPCGSFYLS